MDTPKVGTSPFKEDEQGKKALFGQGEGEKQGSLIKDAKLERPAEVTKTWYRSQGLAGITTTEIVSDLGGQVVIRVTRPLEDKFLQGHILIPQHALIIAKQEGEPKFGASRLGVTLEQIEYPDGAILGLQAKASDSRGAQGLPGDVNNHWGRVFLGADLTALLSIGTRLPAGNQGQDFAPTLAQETSQQAASGIARAGEPHRGARARYQAHHYDSGWHLGDHLSV
jgi:hypothetical protein